MDYAPSNSLKERIKVPKFGLIAGEGKVGLFKSLKGLKGADLRYAVGYNMSTLRAFGVNIPSAVVSLPYDFQQAKNTFDRGVKFLRGGGFSQIGRRAGVLTFASRVAPKLRANLIPRTSSSIFNRYMNIYAGSIIQKEIIGPISRGKSKKDIIEGIWSPEVVEKVAQKEFSSNKSDNFLYKWQLATYTRAVAGAPDPLRNNAFVQAKHFKEKTGKDIKRFDARYGIVKDNGQLLYQSDREFDQLMSSIDQMSLPQAEATVKATVDTMMMEYMAEKIAGEHIIGAKSYNQTHAIADKDRKRAVLQYLSNYSGSRTAFESGSDGMRPELDTGGSLGPFGANKVEVVTNEKGDIVGYTTKKLRTATTQFMGLEDALIKDMQMIKSTLGKQFGVISVEAEEEINLLANQLGLKTPAGIMNAGAETLHDTDTLIDRVVSSILNIGTYNNPNIALERPVQKMADTNQRDLLAILQFAKKMQEKGFSSFARALITAIAPDMGGRDIKTGNLINKMSNALTPKQASSNKKVNRGGKDVLKNKEGWHQPIEKILSGDLEENPDKIYAQWWNAKNTIASLRNDAHKRVAQSFLEGGGLTISGNAKANAGVDFLDVVYDPQMLSYSFFQEEVAVGKSGRSKLKIYDNLEKHDRFLKRMYATQNAKKSMEDPTSPNYIGQDADLRQLLKSYGYEVNPNKGVLKTKGLLGIPMFDVVHPLKREIEEKIRRKLNMGSSVQAENNRVAKIKKLMNSVLKPNMTSQFRHGLDHLSRIPSDLKGIDNSLTALAIDADAKYQIDHIRSVTTNQGLINERRAKRGKRAVGSYDNNYVPSKIDIAESIHIIPIHQKGRAFLTAEVVAGTSQAKVGFADAVRDITAIEYGGPATDASGNHQKRTDGMVYLPSLFFTRACEEAAAYLGFTDTGRVLGFDKTLQRKVGVKFRLGKGQMKSGLRSFNQKKDKAERDMRQRRLNALVQYRKDLRTNLIQKQRGSVDRNFRLANQRALEAFFQGMSSSADSADRYIDAATLLSGTSGEISDVLPEGMGLGMTAFGNLRETRRTVNYGFQGYATSLTEKLPHEKYFQDNALAKIYKRTVYGDDNLPQVQEIVGRLGFAKVFDPALYKQLINAGATIEAANYLKRAKLVAKGGHPGGYEGLSIQNLGDFEFSAAAYMGNDDLKTMLGTNSMELRANVFQTLGLGKISTNPQTGQKTFEWSKKDKTNLVGLITRGRVSTFSNNPLYKLIDGISGPGAQGKLTSHFYEQLRETLFNNLTGLSPVEKRQIMDNLKGQAGAVARKTVSAIQTVMTKHSVGGNFTNFENMAIALEKSMRLLELSFSNVLDKAYFLRFIMEQQGQGGAALSQLIGDGGKIKPIFNVKSSKELNDLANLDVDIEINEEGIASVLADANWDETVISEIEADSRKKKTLLEMNGQGQASARFGGAGASLKGALEAAGFSISEDLGTTQTGIDQHTDWVNDILRAAKDDISQAFILPRGQGALEEYLNHLQKRIPIEKSIGVVGGGPKNKAEAYDSKRRWHQTSSGGMQKSFEFMEDALFDTKVSATGKTAADKFIKDKIFMSVAIPELTHDSKTVAYGNLYDETAIVPGRGGNHGNFMENPAFKYSEGDRVQTHMSPVMFEQLIGNLAQYKSESWFYDFLNTLYVNANAQGVLGSSSANSETQPYFVELVQMLLNVTGIGFDLRKQGGGIYSPSGAVRLGPHHARQIQEYLKQRSRITVGRVRTDYNDAVRTQIKRKNQQNPRRGSGGSRNWTYGASEGNWFDT